jgi:hypothetical protein
VVPLARSLVSTSVQSARKFSFRAPLPALGFTATQ